MSDSRWLYRLWKNKTEWQMYSIALMPAEIAARRAQYEHYRDRLLSFPEKVVSVSDAS